MGQDDEAVMKKVKVKVALKTKIKIGNDTNLSHQDLGQSGSVSNRPITGWECLSLQYSVSWPLHLIISPSVIEKYNDILKFLLTVRRTQCKLHDTWAAQKKQKVHRNRVWQGFGVGVLLILSYLAPIFTP